MLNPYEIVDELGPKSEMFKAFGDEMKRLKEENEQLKKDKATFEQAVLELTMLVGGMPNVQQG